MQSGLDAKAATREAWACGDYHRFAKATVWEVGPVLVGACGIGPGQRVLDVAAGSGNVAIRAAEAGANVVAADLTPAGFEAGRREAHACGVRLDPLELDAAELTRVCRPGGTIGLASFTPESLVPAFFEVFAPYMPPSSGGSLPPVLWGREEHVRELFADRVSWLRLERRVYVERAADPAAYCALCKETFGPIVTVYESLRDDPDAVAALDRSFLDFATRSSTGLLGGSAEYPYEYLLAVARTAV